MNIQGWTLVFASISLGGFFIALIVGNLPTKSKVKTTVDSEYNTTIGEMEETKYLPQVNNDRLSLREILCMCLIGLSFINFMYLLSGGNSGHTSSYPTGIKLQVSSLTLNSDNNSSDNTYFTTTDKSINPYYLSSKSLTNDIDYNIKKYKATTYDIILLAYELKPVSFETEFQNYYWSEPPLDSLCTIKSTYINNTGVIDNIGKVETKVKDGVRVYTFKDYTFYGEDKGKLIDSIVGKEQVHLYIAYNKKDDDIQDYVIYTAE